MNKVYPLALLIFLGCDEGQDGFARTTPWQNETTRTTYSTARDTQANQVPGVLLDVEESSTIGGQNSDDNQIPPNGSLTFVIKKLFFSREAGGISPGFDLDSTISDGNDAQGCYNSDFTSPDDTEGIDNQFALLLPLIEAAGGEALGPYTQTAVNSGNLLLFFELLDVDNVTNDTEVTLRLYRVVGETLVGTDGFLQPWQTFDIDLDSAWIDSRAQIVNGVVVAQGFKFALPFYIFDFYFEARIQNGHLKIKLGQNGVHTGVIGGAVTLANIQEIADAIEGGDDEAALIQRLGSQFADLLPDENGDCQAMSVTLQFETTGAFLFEDSPRFSGASKP